MNINNIFWISSTSHSIIMKNSWTLHHPIFIRDFPFISFFIKFSTNSFNNVSHRHFKLRPTLKIKVNDIFLFVFHNIINYFDLLSKTDLLHPAASLCPPPSHSFAITDKSIPSTLHLNDTASLSSSI